MNEEKKMEVAVDLKLPKSLIVIIGGIAILLLFIGAIIMIAAEKSAGNKIGAVIYDLGIVALGGVLYLGALTSEIDTSIRTGMIIGASIILAMGFVKHWI